MSNMSILIYDSVYKNDIEEGKKLIDLNYKSMPDPEKNALLKLSAVMGRKEFVIHLLSYGLNKERRELFSLIEIIENFSGRNISRNRRNYIDIIILLLNQGVRITQYDMEEAAESGDIELVFLLLSGFKLNLDVIIKAIKYRNTKLVKELIESEYYNLSKKEEKIMFQHAMSNSVEIVGMLINKGMKIPEDALFYGIQSGFEMVKLLLDNGVNPYDLEALEEAAFSSYNISEDSEKIINLLLKKGKFDISDIMNLITKLEEDDEDDYTDIISYIKKLIRIPNLRQQIKESYKRQEFKWQVICSKLNKEGKKELIEFAKELGINVLLKNTKRELCKIISDEMFDIVKSCEDSNLLGDDLNKLPKWRIFKIKGKCYDIIDLKKILLSGETRNPFTREPLPIEEINERITSLEKNSLKGILETEDLFTRVRDTPIFSKKEYLNQQVVKLFGLFPYMLDIDLIIKANDSEINFMTEKLFKSSSNYILQATDNEISKIEKLNGLEKKIAFITLLFNREMSDEKIVILYDAFLYFSKKKNGEDLSDDRFLYMIE
jgi:hypothetical protein